MSMSTHVMGLRDANDPHHVKMVAALEACLAVPLPLPAPDAVVLAKVKCLAHGCQSRTPGFSTLYCICWPR